MHQGKNSECDTWFAKNGVLSEVMDGHKSGDNNEECGICGTIVCGSVEKRLNGTREEALGQKSTTMHQRSAGLES